MLILVVLEQLQPWLNMQANLWCVSLFQGILYYAEHPNCQGCNCIWWCWNRRNIILIMGQALDFGNRMKNSLLCPNQMRANGIVVDDVPMHLAPNGQLTLSIYVPDEDWDFLWSYMDVCLILQHICQPRKRFKTRLGFNQWDWMEPLCINICREWGDSKDQYS